MAHTICTFNVNNLFVRYRFAATFPGDVSAKSAVEDPALGYLPMYNPTAFELFNPTQRELAARVITNDHGDFPDVVCLQEVESLIALRSFNEKHLGSHYGQALLVDSRDLRQIDVGVLSNLPILSVRSHVDELDPAADDPKHPWLFSRDCLEVEVALNKTASKRLTLFINHLKSKFVDFRTAKTPEQQKAARKRGDQQRQRQAERVVAILRQRYKGSAFNQELFAVVGDLNDEPASPPLAPLLTNSGLVDCLGRIPIEEERWTHWFRSENSVSQMDHVLLSPALAAATKKKRPRIERRGISFARVLADGSSGPRQTSFQHIEGDSNPTAVDFRFERFPEVNTDEYASDHCAVFFDVP